MALTLTHIKQLETLARARTFYEAARELDISQPALSRSIAKLEKKLEVPLFNRGKRGTSLTVFGKHILQRGGPILQDVRLLERDLNLLKELEAGEFTIGCGTFSAETIIGPIVARFNKKYPNISIRLIADLTPSLLKLLTAKKMDFFVADTRSLLLDRDIEVLPLPNQQLYFCCRSNHPLAKRKRLPIAKILSYPLATQWAPDQVVEIIRGATGRPLEKITDLPVRGIQCDYLSLVFQIVKDSDAVGITTEEAHRQSVYKSDIHMLPLVLPNFMTNYGIVMNKGIYNSSAIEMLQKFIIEKVSM